MKIFLLDLWYDLRAKRLAPVAVVLLVGLVAVPVLLAKPAADPAPAPVGAAPSKQAEDDRLAALAKVRLGEEGVGKGSTLGTFDPDNPFAPPKGKLKKEGAADLAAAGPGESPSGGGPGADTGSGSGGSVLPFGPGSGGGTTGGGDTGGGTTGDPETKTTVYEYVVDLTFTANGRTRRIKGLEKLDMLPSQFTPLLIFLGVTAKGSDAVFLVDSTLQAAGEGRCKPSPSECAFAYVGPGAEYVFTEDDGDSYKIRIDEIRKVKLDTSARGAEGARARASVGSPRRFVPPVLADLMVVATDRLENSSSDTGSR
jgi:hypothetical protein